MGTINIVKNIKEIHKEDIAIIKIGKFYNIYGKDAYITSYLLGYKIIEVEGIKTCAFPEVSLKKVCAKLEDNKINYLIVDRRNNYEVDEMSTNRNLNNYEKFYHKAKNYVNIRFRIEKVYQTLLEDVDKPQFLDYLRKMEEVQNEGRKIQSN